MYREQLDRPEASALPLALQPGGGGQGQVAKIIIWCEKGALHQNVHAITKPEGKGKRKQESQQAKY